MINLLENALHRDMCGTDVPCIGFYYGKYVEGMASFNAHVADHPIYNFTYHFSERQQTKDDSSDENPTAGTRLPVNILA